MTSNPKLTPELFQHPLGNASDCANGIVSAYDRATGLLYWASTGMANARVIVLDLISRRNPQIDCDELLRRCSQGDRAAILQGLAMLVEAIDSTGG